MGKKSQIKTGENGEDILEEVEESTKGAKKSKKSKKKDFSEDDIAKELEELSLEVNGEVPKHKQKSEDNPQEKKEKKSKKLSKKVDDDDDDDDSDEGIQPTIGGGFAALMDDMGDDDDDHDDDDHDDDEVEEEKPVKRKTKSSKEKKSEKEENEILKPEKTKKEKSKKKKRKGNDDDEDDIDELLAQIESEYKGEKRVVEKKETKLSEEKTSPPPPNDEKNREEEIELASSTEQTKKIDSTKGGEEAKLQQEIKPTETKKPKETKEPPSKKNEKQEETKKEVKANEPKKETKKKEAKESKPIEKPVQKKEEKPSQEDSKKKEKKKPEKEESPKPEEKDDEGSKKKKKGKVKEDKKKEEEDSKARKGKPTKKMLEAMKLMLAKQKEEEERRRKEEEERRKLEEERIRQLEEQRRLEEERKERQKQKQKDRMKRLKEEGKLLTPKQKLEQKRAQAMLEHLKAQGVAIPEAGEKLRAAPVSYKRQKRRKQEEGKEESKDEVKEEVMETKEEKGEEKQEEEPQKEEEEDDVVDAWDQISESEEEEDSLEEKKKIKTEDKESRTEQRKVNENESESENEERQTEAEKRRERAIHRMGQRKAENEKKKSEKRLRAPVVCVLGHVDHGKTKILDKLRRTNVQEGEVGGITQQIGATNVPFEAIKSQTRMVKDFEVDSVRLPGLLIIDTPGHESFSNLRSRGSSLCDIAILVVDITQGLEPQTIESINLLKNRKTPFVVALNKVDRVFEWESNSSKDIREIIKLQNEPCKNDFERRTGEVTQALNVQGLNAALFWENPDPRSYVSLVPTSAISGDGMGNLISLITSMCQKRLSPRLMFSEELQCTVLEVKTIQGHGTTIDVILMNGRLREGDTIVLAGTEGPIVTQIRSLLIPKPMKEIRVKGQYDELKVVEAALGVKVAARELEKAIAGLNLQVANHEDEVDILKEEVDREFKNAMRSIKVKDKGVYVQASTLGALEALLEFFKTNKVPYAGIRVGPVVKRDVMKAAAMLEHDPMYAVILAFDVKVERDAQELADKEGIKIFSEETIYHLGDRYVEYIKEYKKKKQDEFRHVAVFPCRLKILPDAIFNKRDPIILGVTVDTGILRTGTPLCVPSKEFVDIGVVTSLEFDHKTVELAKKGVNVCMKVEPLPGHTPKLFGRHFDGEDTLISKISRESIDACKQYFRDDLGKTEWKLMAELKKEFSIL